MSIATTFYPRVLHINHSHRKHRRKTTMREEGPSEDPVKLVNRLADSISPYVSRAAPTRLPIFILILTRYEVTKTTLLHGKNGLRRLSLLEKNIIALYF